MTRETNMPEPMMTTVAAASRPPPTSMRWAATLRRAPAATSVRGAAPDSAELLGRVVSGRGRAAIDLGWVPAESLTCSPPRSHPAAGWSGWTPTPPTRHGPPIRRPARARRCAGRDRRCQAHRAAAGTFDLVTPDLAGNVPEPQEVLAEMVRLAGRAAGSPAWNPSGGCVLSPRPPWRHPAPRTSSAPARPARRRSAHRPPPDRAVPAGRPEEVEVGCTRGRVPGR